MVFLPETEFLPQDLNHDTFFLPQYFNHEQQVKQKMKDIQAYKRGSI